MSSTADRRAGGVERWLPFSPAGEPLVLHQGELRLVSPTLPQLKAPGEVRLFWNEGAHLRWQVDLPDDWQSRRAWAPEGRSHERFLELDKEGLVGRAAAWALSAGHGWTDGVQLGDRDAPLARVIAHLKGERREGHVRLRQFLAGMDVTTSIDATRTPALAVYAESLGGWDAPRTVVRVRNELIHPTDTQAIYAIDGLVAEASRLAARFLDLAVLHRIGFRGEVRDRTLSAAWEGETEPLPWATQSARSER